MKPMPVVVRALGTVGEYLEKNIKGTVDQLMETWPVLRSARILRRVLETLGGAVSQNPVKKRQWKLVW